MKVGAGGDAGLMSLFRCLEMKDQQCCLLRVLFRVFLAPLPPSLFPTAFFVSLSLALSLSLSLPFPPLSLLPVPAPSLSTVPRFDPPEGVSWEGEKEGRGAGVAGSLAPLLWDDERA